MNRNPNCNLCPLHEGVGTICVWGEEVPSRLWSRRQCDVMVIGEAPGWNEDKAGRPFVGDSGRLIREKLEAAGITNYYITNVAKCRPPQNRTPTAKEAKACRVYLDEEIRTVKPKYIIALGSLAAKTVLKKSKITQEHGQLVTLPNGVIGMPVYHPAYALRDPSKLPAIEHDLARFARAMRGEYEETPEIPWRIVTAKTFDQFIREFRESDEFSFDVETSSLDWFKPDQFIRCIGIGLQKRAWVMPLDMPGSPYLNRPEAVRDVLGLLTLLAGGKIAVAQNGKFDNHWIRAICGRKFNLCFDTMLAHHILDENQDHDLKYMSRAYLDAPEYDIPKADKLGRGLEIPEKWLKFLRYCAMDAWYTLKLKGIFEKQLSESKQLYRLFYKLVIPAARALEDIEEEGLTLDLPKYVETEIRVRKERDEALEILNDTAHKAGSRAINWNSPKQVATLLFEDIGIKSTVKTATGAPSTGEEALLAIKGTHPVADQLIKFRELEKFLGTYIEGWKEYTVDGKLYLGYKIHGTVTGRYSSRLHQVPRDGAIRNLVTAPPGWEFAQADLSQAELRIAAELSRDLELVACFQPGGPDVHWRTMLHVIGSGASGEYNDLAKKTATKIAESLQEGLYKLTLPDSLELLRKTGHEAAIAIDKTWKEARKRGKSINFGFVFGMYENKFIETCKLKYGYEPTFDEARAFRQAYFELYAGIPPWHEKQKTLCKLDGQVTDLFGRVRRLPGIHSRDRELRGEAERQSINSPVQGTIGDWKTAALIEIHETISRDKLRIVGEHHDALLMIVRPEYKDEVLPRVREIMRKPKLLKIFKINNVVPMDSEIEVGPWGAGVKYENPTDSNTERDRKSVKRVSTS